MRQPTRLPNQSTPLARLLSWVGLALMGAMFWLGQAGPSEARLDPYYIVRGQSFGTIAPQVLFVLDTSGSMSRQASAAAGRCRWSRCESDAYAGTAEESRLSAARRAVEAVVEGSGESASFSFMTFVQNGAETQSAPPMCTDHGEPTRFLYVTRYRDWAWWDVDQILRAFDAGDPGEYAGALRLCQGDARRPYAYIRWDELGVGSVVTANNSSGELPPSPLISLAQADYEMFSNRTRRVQFFPEFVGVRAQLNIDTDPTQDILNATVGDYSIAEVWENDFYYWPYVDGFPGYGAQDVARVTGTGAVWDNGGNDGAGVAGDEDWFPGVQLHAPFFLDLSSTAIPPENWGPSSEQEALDVMLSRTAPLIEGGVDADGSTPWSSAIGDAPTTPIADNSPGSHASVSSYLAFLNTVPGTTACAPTSVVLLTDGEPTGGEGGSDLFRRLSALRRDLGASVYVVGFFLGTGGQLNDMACAAAGACDGLTTCNSPCTNEPARDWDTCQDSDDPTSSCAYIANSTGELEAILSSIIDDALAIDVDSGPGSVINEFGAEGASEDAEATQTIFSAVTEYPGWRGHVTRRYCVDRDDDDNLLPQCEQPVPEFPTDGTETFGPCGRSRDWDAGECLQLMNWYDRRIYSHDENNVVYRITEEDGAATVAFANELVALGHISAPDIQAKADEIAAFLLGRDATGGWKLPGISNSAPITVRRVPQYNSERLPEVPINDPHCAGRRFGELDAGTLPNSLEEFSQEAWEDEPNYEYQEAVIVGDDFGIIHAFQLDSGNELFGLLPRFALSNAVDQVANGVTNMGQPEDDDLENHIFGVASTMNHGWVYDEAETRWRHLGVLGMGEGGHEMIALDLSHMNPDVDPPVDVLWTTEDTAGGRDEEYDDYLGETWARPALSYHVEDDQMINEPQAFLVFGSGYAPEGAPVGTEQGRTLVVADAVTGDILDHSVLPPLSGPVYEDDFGAVVDPAISSHCFSRYWAESQEAYIADPAGRLFRWDLGRDTVPLTFKNDADSGSEWTGEATPVFTFPACTGTGTTCTVTSGNPGDPFVYGASVSAFNRLDDVTAGAISDVVENDQALVALVSGSPNEAELDGGDPDNDFHTSLYLLADDHSSGDPGDGFDIPAGAPKSGGAFAAGDSVSGNPGYMRVAVTDIERTRVVTPFPGATTFSETRNFSKAARPVRAPRIYVTGVVDDSGETPVVIEDVEVFYVTYYIYEPGTGECDPRFYDAENDEWYLDYGSTYEVTFRLTADSVNGFEFNSGSAGGTSPVDFETGFETGLRLDSVEQSGAEECPSGNCGARPGTPDVTPCDNNIAPEDLPPDPQYAIPMSSRQLPAFSPVEG